MYIWFEFKIVFMKKILLTLIMTVGFTMLSHAQQQAEPFGQKMSFGFQLGQYQDDFGIGLNVTTPYFLHNRVAVRVRGNLMWHEHVLNTETTWTPYSNLALGVIGVGGNIGNFMRVYGEGGAMVLVPSDDFSAQSTEFGGYGLFGFEFFMDPHFNYFIEIGGAGTGARADKVPTSPIYSNGLIIQTGFRIQL